MATTQHAWDPTDSEGLFEPATVHQAVGMVIAQLQVEPRQALQLLRHYADRLDQPVDAVAQRVIRRNLVFQSSPEEMCHGLS